MKLLPMALIVVLTVILTRIWCEAYTEPIICESQELAPSHEPYTYGTMKCNVGSVSGPEVQVIVID